MVHNIRLVKGDDFVQCVPTKKGHQILFKGYTYVFKNLDQLPEWTLIYFTKVSEEEMKCNLCDGSLKVEEKSFALLEHLKETHTDIYYLHKDNPEATVGFRIEFLNLNMLKEDGDPKTQPILLGEVCEAATTEPEDILPKEDTLLISKASEIVIKDSDMQYVLYDESKKKQNITVPRKRSWIWKYFDKLSDIIYRCRLCSVVLSIKGCNSNNMNRHVRTQHPTVFNSEVIKRDKLEKKINFVAVSSEIDDEYVDKTEEIYTSNKDCSDVIDSPTTKKIRRSWIWSYFVRVSDTQAQCKLCKRHISHGGNATGNMNRHLKMIHRKTSCAFNKTWVWKVFDNTEEDYYSCKICHYKSKKCHDPEKDMLIILDHLKSEHGVVSGDQIITSNEVEDDDIE